MQGYVIGAGEPVDHKTDWVFLILKFKIVIRGNESERKQGSKQKTKIIPGNSRFSHKK